MRATLGSFSRSKLLGAGAATALVGVSMMRDLVRAAEKADPRDMETLNAALQLERAGIQAYDYLVTTNMLSSRLLAVALAFKSDHEAHADALTAAVKAGGAAVTTKTAQIAYPTLASEDDIVKFALDFEEKAASTYLSVISDFTDRNLAAAAASILGVETTHVALLSSALGSGRPYPRGFVN